MASRNDSNIDALEDLGELIDSQSLKERFKRNFMKGCISMTHVGLYKGRVVALFEEIDEQGRPLSHFYAGRSTIEAGLRQMAQKSSNSGFFPSDRRIEIITRERGENALEAIASREEAISLRKSRRLMHLKKSCTLCP